MKLRPGRACTAKTARAASTRSRSARARSATCTATASLHIGFPKAIWHELHDAGRIDYHPVFPNKPGFGSRAIASEEDRRDVIALLRLNYDRVIERYGLPTP